MRGNKALWFGFCIGALKRKLHIRRKRSNRDPPSEQLSERHGLTEKRKGKQRASDRTSTSPWQIESPRRSSNGENDTHFPIPTPPDLSNTLAYDAKTLAVLEGRRESFASSTGGRHPESEETPMLDSPFPANVGLCFFPERTSTFESVSLLVGEVSAKHEARLVTQPPVHPEQSKAVLDFVDGIDHLQETVEELTQARQQLEERTAKYDRLCIGFDRLVDYSSRMGEELRHLQREHETCTDRLHRQEQQIRVLLKCRFKTRRQLKQKINELREIVDLCREQVRRQTGSLQERNERIRQCQDRLQRQEELIARQRQQHIDDGEALKELQTELYDVYRNLRTSKRGRMQISSAA